MSVYTEVPADALNHFLRDYALGEVLALDGILDGVENTNYFLTTSCGRYVLTLFEATPAAALPFCLDFMACCAAYGVPAPRPVRGRDGIALRRLCERPAAVVECLPGRSVSAPSEAQCAAVGSLLGRMHRAAAGFSGTRSSARGSAWRLETGLRLASRAGPADLCLLREELGLQAQDPLAGLPAGVVHGDLFRDNVLFEGPRLSGVIDFYYAATEPFIYDLAVAASDWGFTRAGADPPRLRALLGAYRGIREVSTAERAAWPTALRAAGLRFWLSRLHDALFRKPGSMVLAKDPAACRAIVLAARREPERLQALWD